MPSRQDDNNDPPDLFQNFSIRGLGGWLGAQRGLQDIVRDRATQAALQRAQQIEDFKNILEARKQRNEEDKTSETAREFDLNAPTREANVSHVKAQAQDLLDKPNAAALANQRLVDAATVSNDRAVVLKVIEHTHRLIEESQKNGDTAAEAVLTRQFQHAEGLLRDKNRIDVKEAGGGAAGGGKLNPTTQRLIAQNESILGGLDLVEQNLPVVERFMGPVQGRVTGAATLLPDFLSQEMTGKMPQEVYDTQTTLANIKNLVINARTGAAVRESEEPRLLQEIPTMNDKGPYLRAKINRMRNVISFINRRYAQLGSGQALEPMPDNFDTDAGGDTSDTGDTGGADTGELDTPSGGGVLTRPGSRPRVPATIYNPKFAGEQYDNYGRAVAKPIRR